MNFSSSRRSDERLAREGNKIETRNSVYLLIVTDAYQVLTEEVENCRLLDADVDNI